MGGGDRLPKGYIRSGSAIDLSYVLPGRINWQSLGARLANDHSITTLYFIGATIESRAAEGIASLLKGSHLTRLHLVRNEIIGSAVRTIAEALGESATLFHFTLSDNAIGDTGIITVARALERNRALIYLDISNTGFGDRGADAMAGMLRKGSSLRRLVMSDNNISNSAQQRLKKVADSIENFALVGLTEKMLSDSDFGSRPSR